MIARTQHSSDQIIADRGEKIYEEQFQAEYEHNYSGQYVVIDILTKSAYVAAFPEEALNKAKAIAPNGLFHLTRIGPHPLPGTDQVLFHRPIKLTQLGSLK